MNILGIFGNRKVELDEEQLAELEERILSGKRIKDLNPGDGKKRKEPVKPWGRRERLFILATLLVTAAISLGLMLSSRGFRFPKLNQVFNFAAVFGNQTIIIGNKKENLEAEKAKKITRLFEEKTGGLSGTYTFYFFDLKTGFSFGLGQGGIMKAASLIKLPVMLYSQDKTDLVKIKAMGKRSDNAVFNELVNKFGRENLQEYIASLGMGKTSLAENETTPKETGDLLAKVYRDKNEVILECLTDTVFEDWLRAGIPKEIRVAHKFGRELGVINDAGIVFASKPFVLVIMAEGIIEKEANQVFPELAQMIYSGYEED